MRSTDETKESEAAEFQSSEETWFAEPEERARRRSSQPPPPPEPIGDDLADGWFR